jgi:DNA polymerase-3 subunit alpha
VFEDLVALVALYRPGPLGSAWSMTLLTAVMDGGNRYELPELEPILRLWRDCLSRTSYADCYRWPGLPGGADLLRRAMGKKKAEVMAEQREHFVRGAVGNGYRRQSVAHF